MNITAYDIAQRFIGMKEIPGSNDNPFILSMLQLDADWPTGDEVPWCSAFVNYVAWLLRLPRSKSLLARSWLQCGRPVGGVGALASTERVGFDVVILSRGTRPQPGTDNFTAPGHVGFFAGYPSDDVVTLLGGNQGDSVSIGHYPIDRILGIRRLH